MDERYTKEDVQWTVTKLQDKIADLKDEVAGEEGTVASATITDSHEILFCEEVG